MYIYCCTITTINVSNSFDRLADVFQLQKVTKPRRCQ